MLVDAKMWQEKSKFYKAFKIYREAVSQISQRESITKISTLTEIKVPLIIPT